MAANHAAVVSLAGSTPIATGAYTVLDAATPFKTSKIIIANGTDQSVTLAIGATGSEVDLVCVGKGATVVLDLSLNQMPAGSNLSVEAVGAATTTGTYTLSMIP